MKNARASGRFCLGPRSGGRRRKAGGAVVSAHAAHTAHTTHRVDVEVGTVDEGGSVGRLPFARRGDDALELAADAFGAPEAEFAQRLCCGEEFVVGAKAVRVAFHIGGKHRRRFVEKRLKCSALKEVRNEGRKARVIKRKVLFIVENPREHRTGIRRAAGRGRVHGVVHKPGRVRRALEAAEGEVVVPGNHREHAVLLIEVIVVDHGAGVAVEVDHEVVRRKVADDGFHIHGFFDVRVVIEAFERGNQAALVRAGKSGLRAVEDIGIVRRIVVAVDEGNVA